MTQAERPQEKPSEELQALRRRVAELEALEVQRQADTKPLQLRDEPLYKAVFESANDSLFLVDKKGNILDFNDRLTEVGGYQKEELVGKNIRSLAGKVTRKSQIIMVTNFLKRMANIRIPPYEVEMYKKNGELLTVEISARPLRKDGKIIGDLAILRDVTERKRIENEIRQKSSELQLINSINDAANRGLSLTELIQVVSEEIQNLYGGFAAITYFLNKDKQSLVARNYKFPSRMVHAIEKLIHMKMSEINFSLKEGSIHSETLKTGKAQVTNGILALQKMPEEYTDDKTLQRLLPMVVKIMGVRSVITVPLISEGEAIGLLDIARHEPLTDCHPERMQTIASQFVNVIKRKQAEEALKASEQNFRNSIDSSSLGIRISDIDNHTLYANQTLLDIFGYKNIEEVKIKAPQEFYSQESYADYLKMSEKYGCGGIILDQVDIDIIRKDGTVRHLQTVFKEVFWDGKQQYQSLYHDITENKNIEVALRESEEKYRTIFESANDILILLDAEGKILDVNKRLTEMGGYDRYELIDKNITELTHIIDEQNMAIVVGNLWKMVTTGKAVTYQVEMIKKNRELISLEINAVPLQKEGKVVGVLGILRDITERNKSELRIRESEEKYRTIFESANDILMLLDTNGKILDVNGRLTEIGGYDRYELIDKNFLELTYIIDKKNMAIVLTNLQKIVAGSGIVTYQVEMVKKNQEPIFMEINAVPVLKESKIIGVLAILRDITERRKSELLLREQKALTDRILKSTPNVVAVVGRDQRIIMVNNTFEHTFELGEGQAEGKNIGQFIPVPHLLDKISHVLTSRETQFQIEFRIKRGVVVMLWVADIISMEQNEVLIVLRDITEEREMQERLYLTDRLASVGEMAAGIAHELNNPLTGVVALSQLLLESGVPDDMRDDIVAISKEGQRAAEVVRNLLSFARSHTLSISSTDINTVIKEVLSLRAYEHNVNNIMVATNLAPDLPEIMTDRFQMQQVFLNIILNAEHAMIESNKRGNLMVTTEQNNGIVKISFANDGPAIPPNIINRIFDPFFTTNDVGKGTGLGLSICYGIVTKQGGKIYAQSQEGKGATFIV